MVRAVSPTAQYLVETTVTLVAVVAVSVVVLYAARRLGLGTSTGQGPLALVARLPLDQRRAIYLIRAGDQLLVVGGGEGGLVKLGDLPADALPPATQAPKPASFREILALAGRKESPVDDPRSDDPQRENRAEREGSS
jgi:flagellar biogenesis protein FliO